MPAPVIAAAAGRAAATQAGKKAIGSAAQRRIRDTIYQQGLDNIKANAREQSQEELSGNTDNPGISPLDPDFILMLLLVAIPFDILAIVLAVITILGLGIPYPIFIVVELIPFAIIGLWSYWRMKKMIQRRKDIEKGVRSVGAGVEKVALKTEAKFASKFLLRGLRSALGQLSLILAVIPFWSITVCEMLKEKAE